MNSEWILALAAIAGTFGWWLSRTRASRMAPAGSLPVWQEQPESSRKSSLASVTFRSGPGDPQDPPAAAPEAAPRPVETKEQSRGAAAGKASGSGPGDPQDPPEKKSE